MNEHFEKKIDPDNPKGTKNVGFSTEGLMTIKISDM